MIKAKRGMTPRELMLAASEEGDKLERLESDQKAKVDQAIDKGQHEQARDIALTIPVIRTRIAELRRFRIFVKRSYARELEKGTLNGGQCQCGIFVPVGQSCKGCKNPACTLHSLPDPRDPERKARLCSDCQVPTILNAASQPGAQGRLLMS